MNTRLRDNIVTFQQQTELKKTQDAVYRAK
jgi:hypothetical protein